MFNRIFCALLLAVGMAHAESLTLVSGDDYAPYADSKLPAGGMTGEIVTKAFDKVKVAVAVEWRPWARGYLESKAGKYAGTYPYAKNAERQADFLFSDVLVRVAAHAWTSGANHGKFNFANPASLAGTTLCQPLGYILPPKLINLIEDGRIKRLAPPEMASCLRMVVTGAADYLVATPSTGDALRSAAKLQREELVIDQSAVLFDNSLHLIISKAQPHAQEIISDFNRGLVLLHQSGEYDRIVKKHAR